MFTIYKYFKLLLLIQDGVFFSWFSCKQIDHLQESIALLCGQNTGVAAVDKIGFLGLWEW